MVWFVVEGGQRERERARDRERERERERERGGSTRASHCTPASSGLCLGDVVNKKQRGAGVPGVLGLDAGQVDAHLILLPLRHLHPANMCELS